MLHQYCPLFEKVNRSFDSIQFISIFEIQSNEAMTSHEDEVIHREEGEAGEALIVNIFI